MTRRIIAAALGAAVLFWGGASPAAAQLCGQGGDVLGHLAEEFGEAPVARGVTEGGALIEVLISRDGATWTILALLPDGTTCLLGSGQTWEAIPWKEPVKGKGT